MTTNQPIEIYNGMITCPTCATKPALDLELPRLEYIEIPSLSQSFNVQSYNNVQKVSTIIDGLTIIILFAFIILSVSVLLGVRK